MKYTFNEFENMVVHQSFSNRSYRKHTAMVEKIKEYIKVEDIERFYPKNLFVDDKDIELYVFTDDKIIFTKYAGEDENNHVKVQINFINKESIESIHITESNQYTADATLMVKIKNNECIVFNGKEDTNEHHSHNFRDQVLDIARYLI